MATFDLDGPLSDFKERTKQIREIVVSIESISKNPRQVSTSRSTVDLKTIDAQTANTANSMALIFLASSFEEFVRETTIQCAGAVSEKYQLISESQKHLIREAYWKASRDQLKYASILSNKSPDPKLIAKVRAALDSQQGFVINNDASKLTASVFSHHTNNFKPTVVVDIMSRLGITKLLETMSDNKKLKNYFGSPTKANCASQTKAKWIEFYDRRNETVHSLSSTTGFSIEVIFGYIDFLELVAEAMNTALLKKIGEWG